MLLPYVRVAKPDAEEVRRRLAEARCLKVGVRVAREGDDVYFPVEESASLLGFKLESGLHDFEEVPVVPRDYTELVDLPEELRASLPSSFDVIGDIIVIKLPEDLRPQRHEIGTALLKANPHVAVVAIDRGVKGNLRVRDVEIVAGVARTVTEHREYGLRFKVDIARAYFSPRLATERNRVASQVRGGERVLDMFAGVGPFSIMVAKLGHPERVYAVDLNPEAYALLLENIAINRVGGVVNPILGDGREVARTLDHGVDRVIMNLPHGASAFLADGLASVGEGGVVHYHFIAKPQEARQRAQSDVSKSLPTGRSATVRALQEVRNYSPEERHFVADVVVNG